MKLTQKQLASLAKVSTPTVSRFENDREGRSAFFGLGNP